MTTNTQFPKRGEIWLVNFDPTVGSEQLRGVDLQRFIRKIGSVSDLQLLSILAAIVTVIEADQYEK